MHPLSLLTRALSLAIAAAEPPADARPAFRHLTDTLLSAMVREHFDAVTSGYYDATLDAAIAAAGGATAAACRALPAVRKALPWVYHYEERAGEESLATRIAFAELIGPDGPMSAADARIGFTLMAPHTFYPLHAHPAVELYWVMSGHADWITAGPAHVAAPGRFVLHQSNQPHAMRTREEPLLALWGWSGDIDTPAFYL
jgi:hypothetical protein